MAGATQPPRRGRKHNIAEANVQEGAGGLLLLAAASETGLLGRLETAMASCSPSEMRSLLSCSPRCCRHLLLTLLFLPLSGLRRTRDLRGYTGHALGLLVGRSRAYGYCHTERFLSQLARADGAEALTTALGSWTAHLWQASGEDAPQEPSPCFYIDGHRKPVYTDCLLPRGLIGRSGKILGCRALVLVHDEQGHPRLCTTSRGDQHLTAGLPQALARYEQAGGETTHARIIVAPRRHGSNVLEGSGSSRVYGGDLIANGSLRGAGVLHGCRHVCAIDVRSQRSAHPRGGTGLLRASFA